MRKHRDAGPSTEITIGQRRQTGRIFAALRYRSGEAQRSRATVRGNRRRYRLIVRRRPPIRAGFVIHCCVGKVVPMHLLLPPLP